MRLSELYAEAETAGDIHAYTAYLAAPDADGTDVDLVPVGRVELNEESKEVRLYPASTSTDTDEVEPEPYLGMVLSQLPGEVTDDNDFRIMVEIPLLRDEPGRERVRFTELVDLYVGRKSEEAWLLVRPPSEFASGVLPD